MVKPYRHSTSLLLKIPRFDWLRYKLLKSNQLKESEWRKATFSNIPNTKYKSIEMPRRTPM